MPAGVKPVVALGGFRQKLHRIGLGGHGRFEAHVEVLFPAHDSRIRAAESRRSRVFVQLEKHGGKLLFFGRVEMIGKSLHLHFAEAFAF